MSNDTPVLPPRGNAVAEAVKELGATGAIKAIAAYFESKAPGTGGVVDGFFSWLKDGVSAYTQARREDMVLDFIEIMAKRVEALESELAAKATWEYLTRPRYAVETLGVFETALRAREKEKARAALNFAATVAVEGDAGDKQLQDYVAAFIRDCTGLDISVLSALAPAGTYLSPHDGRLGGEGLTLLREWLHTNLGAATAEVQALVDASATRLMGMGLCDALHLFDGKEVPIQRSPLGERVYLAIREVVKA